MNADITRERLNPYEKYFNLLLGTESEKKRAQEKLMKTMSELTHLHIPNMLTDLHATILKDFMNQLASKHSTAIFYSQPKSSHMVQYGKVGGPNLKKINRSGDFKD